MPIEYAAQARDYSEAVRSFEEFVALHGPPGDEHGESSEQLSLMAMRLAIAERQ